MPSVTGTMQEGSRALVACGDGSPKGCAPRPPAEFLMQLMASRDCAGHLRSAHRIASGAAVAAYAATSRRI